MDITRIPVPRTGAPGGRTNAHVLGERDALLVDPAGRADALDAAVEEGEVANVAVTHHHPDHVGAVAGYARERDATVWARTGRTRAFAAAAGIEPDRRLRDGTVIPTGDGTVRVVDTPGHAPEHVAFVADGAAVVGDLVVAEGSVAVAAPEGDMRAYLSSLRRLHARDFDRLYPGHGPAVDDPRAALARLLSHRLDRERRVAAAVRDGADTVDAVLDAAYEKDVSGVRDLARATVVAHLEKLAVEDRVRFDGEQVRPV